MTFKKYGVQQVDWRKAKEVPTNKFRNSTVFNKKKLYDIIQWCMTQTNISTFDKTSVNHYALANW